MGPTRPFLSYSKADRRFVEEVAAGLVLRGLLPIYDLWWLRSGPAEDSESAEQELKMGVSHADAFIYFDSHEAARSRYVKLECDWAMWRTCSGAPDLPMICVLLDDPEAHVPHWFGAKIDATLRSNDVSVLVSDVLRALGSDPDKEAASPVRKCRSLARGSSFDRLRAELENPAGVVRREAAILLAFLDEELDLPWLQPVLRELEHALETGEAGRAVLALGKLRSAAAPATGGIARFVESGADPFERARAIRVLGRIGPSDETISILARVAEAGRQVRKAAVTELGHMGARAEAAVPTLVKLAARGDLHLRLVALTALGKIGDCRPEVLVVVLQALAETERQGISPSELHHNAMAILNQLAPSSSELARALSLARQGSWRFETWFRENSWLSEGDPEADLEAAARNILIGCRLAGPARPF